MAKFRFIIWLVDWLESQSSLSFEWDDGNSLKNLHKHGITCEEAESIFYQTEMIRVLGEQISPKVNEPRFGLFGLTITGKSVLVCFTLSGSGIQIISARELNKKELIIYADLCQD